MKPQGKLSDLNYWLMVSMATMAIVGSQMGCAPAAVDVTPFELLKRPCERVILKTFWDKESISGCDDKGKLIAMPSTKHPSKAQTIGGIGAFIGAAGAAVGAASQIKASSPDISIPSQ